MHVFHRYVCQDSVHSTAQSELQIFCWAGAELILTETTAKAWPAYTQLMTTKIVLSGNHELGL